MKRYNILMYIKEISNGSPDRHISSITLRLPLTKP